MRWNYLLGLVYTLLVFVIGFWFTKSVEQPQSLNSNLFHIVPVITNEQDTTYKAEEILNIPYATIKIVILTSLGLSALFAFINGTDFFGKGYYTTQIQDKINWFRWIEFAITGSLMYYATATLLGVKDSYFMLISVISFMVCCIQGGVIETFLTTNQENMIIFPVLVIIGLLTVIIGVLINSFIIRDDAVRKAGYRTPDWLYVLLIGTIILLGAFAIIQILYIYQIFRFKPTYKNYEIAYILIALISKTFLALTIAYGLSRNNNTVNPT
jgi:hypothetical protein